MVEEVPVVSVDEVPGDRIRASLATYRWLFGDDGWAAARAHAPGIQAAIAAVEPRWVDELSRWADAADADLGDLLVLNARSELLSVVRSGRRRGECTVLADAGVLGQTWDWFGRQRDALVLLRTDGLLTLTEAGMLAKIGVNRHGLAVGLAYLASPSDRVPGAGHLPVHAALRRLLERSSSVADAVAELDGLALAGSASIALADTVAAAHVEITPTDRAVLPAGVHTNHCVDLHLRTTQGAVDFLADSEHRFERGTALRRAGVTTEDLLADTEGGHHAIDQPPDPDLDPHDRTETVVAITVDPARRAVRIAPGRPSRTGFTQEVALT